MFLYRLLDRLFPQSFAAKVAFVTFLGLAIAPGAGMALLIGGGTESTRPVVTLLAFAGVCGLLVTLFALRALLDPVYRVTEVLDRWGRTGQVDRLPEGHRDEVGRLMSRTNLVLGRAQRSLDQSRREEDSDPVTGALNRRGAERLLRDAPSGWVLAVSLDGFDAMTQRVGTGECERVLREVVQLWSETLRQDDLLAREEGGSFLLFLPGAPTDVATRIAERLRVEVESKVRAGGLGVTASFGLASHPGGEGIGTALDLASVESRRASEAGGNRLCTLERSAA